MAKKIRAVIFDLGGVLVGFKANNFVPMVDSFVPLGKYIDWCAGTAKPMKQFETGNISPKQFYKKILPFMKIKISFGFFEKKWGDFFIFRPRVLGLLKRLRKRGYKIGILSNTSRLHFQVIEKKYCLRNNSDALALSFIVHSMKPDKKIFSAAVKGLKEKPENCVYIDDLRKYVVAARGYGFNALQYRDFRTLKKELRELGVTF